MGEYKIKHGHEARKAFEWVSETERCEWESEEMCVSEREGTMVVNNWLIYFTEWDGECVSVLVRAKKRVKKIRESDKKREWKISLSLSQ